MLSSHVIWYVDTTSDGISAGLRLDEAHNAFWDTLIVAAALDFRAETNPESSSQLAAVRG